MSALFKSVGLRPGLLGKSAKRIVLLLPLLMLFRILGSGERGSEKSGTVGDSHWRAANATCFGGSASLKPPRVGEYTLSPQLGSASGLGDTDIGARSYVFGECVVYVECKRGEGGKCTCGD